MIEFQSGEKIIRIARKHWFVMVGPIVFALIMAVFFPTVVAFVLGIAGDISISANIIYGGLLLYFMFLIIFVLVSWVNYYLDVWVVTNHRIIDVEQHSFFVRQVSEIPLYRVQDATVEFYGFFQTILNFGAIKIQTAGEREFLINLVAEPEKVREVILKYTNDLVHTDRQWTEPDNKN